jgi:hypothetical protein
MTQKAAPRRATFVQTALPIVFLALVMIGGVRGVVNRLHPAAGAADTIGWKQLAEGSVAAGKAVYPAALAAQEGKRVCITGYMYPLQGGETQSRFLLSAYQPTCPFCLPGGPREMIEVTGTDEKVAYSANTATLCGLFHLLTTPEELQGGMMYQMAHAVVAR